MSQNMSARKQLEYIYKKEEKAMYNIAFRWVWNKEDSMDLVQESFLKLWSHKNLNQIENVRAFLYKVLLNMCSNKKRANKIRNFIGLDKAQLQYDNELCNSIVNKEELIQVNKVIDLLSKPLKQVILLYYFSEMDYEQISHTLKIPKGTVASRKNKATIFMRTKLLKQGVVYEG